MMKLSLVLTVLLAGGGVLFVSGAESSPHFQAPMFSPLPLQAGLKCGLVDGQLVCGNKNSSGKHHQDNDQQGNDDDHHHKKKKNNDDDTGLSECTIQGANSGGGCKGGFKRVCEKLKSGKKCCGCVVDKNAVPATNPNYGCCEGFGADGNKVGEKLCGDININKEILKNTYHATTITCPGH